MREFLKRFSHLLRRYLLIFNPLWHKMFSFVGYWYSRLVRLSGFLVMEFFSTEQSFHWISSIYLTIEAFRLIKRELKIRYLRMFTDSTCILGCRSGHCTISNAVQVCWMLVSVVSNKCPCNSLSKRSHLLRCPGKCETIREWNHLRAILLRIRFQ